MIGGRGEGGMGAGGYHVINLVGLDFNDFDVWGLNCDVWELNFDVLGLEFDVWGLDLWVLRRANKTQICDTPPPPGWWMGGPEGVSRKLSPRD